MTRDLPCKLSTEEVQARASEAADLHLEIKTLREEAKASARAAREEIGEKEDRAEELARAVRTRVETRPVQCEERFDDNRCIVQTIRLDTSETVSERTMSNEEKQRRFPFSEDEIPSAPNVTPIGTAKKRGRKPKNGEADMTATPPVEEPSE